MEYAVFTKKKILIVHSQQLANPYAGGGSGQPDSEQHWMRLLALETYDLLKVTGHDVRLGPLGYSYADNVAWVQKAENRDADELWSFHSNATATAGDAAVGIGVYHYPTSARGAAIAKTLAPLLGPVAATGKSYVSTLTVAELAKTTPPAVLIEHEFHDHDGPSPGGADWIRDPRNRTAIAKAYLSYVVTNYGSAAATPVPPVPTVPVPSPTPEAAERDVKFRFATFNMQLPQFGGGPVGEDVSFIKNVLRPSILACQEVNEDYRKVVESDAGFNYYTDKTLLLGWLPAKWKHGAVIKAPLGTAYHGLVGTELTSMVSGNSLIAASLHGLPSASFPSGMSSGERLKAKLSAIDAMVSELDCYPRVVIGGDWNVQDARGLMYDHGFRLASPYAPTLDASEARYDLVFIKGLEARSGGYIHKTDASDHHGVLANLTLPGKALS